MPTTLITDSAHYTTVLNLAMKAKHSLKIGTADIKDLYVLQVKTEKPFLGVPRRVKNPAYYSLIPVHRTGLGKILQVSQGEGLFGSFTMGTTSRFHR